MKNKLILIGIVILGLLFFYFMSKKSSSNSTEVIINSQNEELQDSIFHKSFCFDYGKVYWTNKDSSLNKSKAILFDYYGGKILVYDFKNEVEIDKIGIAPANKVFWWNFNEVSVDNLKIVGFDYSKEESDTIMYWNLNKEMNTLIDDKEKVFTKHLK